MKWSFSRSWRLWGMPLRKMAFLITATQLLLSAMQIWKKHLMLTLFTSPRSGQLSTGELSPMFKLWMCRYCLEIVVKICSRIRDLQLHGTRPVWPDDQIVFSIFGHLFTAINICPKAYKLCQSELKTLPKTEKTLNILPNVFKYLPKFWIFAKKGHTER